MTDGAPRCRKCDGFLVLRKGKFGDFYGCSNFPQCRGTRTVREVGFEEVGEEDPRTPFYGMDPIRDWGDL